MNMAIMKIGDFVEVAGSANADDHPFADLDWFMLRIHGGKEAQVEQMFTRYGIPCYLPTFQKEIRIGRWKHWTIARTRKVRAAIFPGLMFVPPTLTPPLDDLKRMSSSIGNYFAFGADPTVITPKLFREIREFAKWYDTPQATARAKKRALQTGDQVRIAQQGNPFDMWIGRIDRLDEKGRLRVLIEIMKREVKVLVTEDQVEPV